MQKRKGFTLVELVIVIAVIAILAGVLIGTFASVLSKANESARMQEMKAAEHDQKASDILEKLNNAQWFGWEDLETKIGTAIQSSVEIAIATANKKTDLDLENVVKTAVSDAVDSAIAKYAVSQGQDNTQLTAEQVQYIVEQAVSKKGGVTEAQVQAIVTNAVKNLNTQTPLSANQVQRIVDAAVKRVTDSGLTASDLATALANVAKTSDFDTILNAVNTAASKQSTLTADEVAAIVAKYVYTDGTVKGDYSWYVPQQSALSIKGEKAAEQLVALSTISASGETFEGQTITIEKVGNNAPTIVLKGKWNPIKTFSGTLEGNGATITDVDMDVVYYGAEANGSTVYTGLNSDGKWYGEKKVYGFINILENGIVENLTINYKMTWSEDPNCIYTYFGGVAGGIIGTSTIKNCEVGGTINFWGRAAGIVGYLTSQNGKVYKVIIDGCKNTADITTRLSKVADDGSHLHFYYAVARQMVAWAGAGGSGNVSSAVEVKTSWTGSGSMTNEDYYNKSVPDKCEGGDIGYAALKQVTVEEGLRKTNGGTGDSKYVNITTAN